MGSDHHEANKFRVNMGMNIWEEQVMKDHMWSFLYSLTENPKL